MVAKPRNEALNLEEINLVDDNTALAQEMTDMMNSLVTASNHQMTIALELTKLISTHSSDLSAEKILQNFQDASIAVTRSFPLRNLCEELG